MSKERILYLDVIRIVACVMIIMMHAPIPNTGLSSYVLNMDNMLTTPGVGLFVMVSGALLLPVQMHVGLFLKKRITKILIPTLFWTFFYMFIGIYENGLNPFGIWRSIISIPFSAQFSGVLWFVYMLIGLYLLAPVISPWLEKCSKKELQIYLGIWAVTLCYPLIRNIINVNESATGILYYFGGYAGYFLLGYYIRRYAPSISVVTSFLLIALPFAAGVFCKLQRIQVDFSDVFYYLSILTVCAAIGWFVLLQRVVPSKVSENMSNRIAMISNCCFGIYLAHIFVMRTVLWKWNFLHELGAIQIIATLVLTFVGSLLITWLLSALPFGAYLVGFRKQ